jgi:hypothetical protein
MFAIAAPWAAAKGAGSNGSVKFMRNATTAFDPWLLEARHNTGLRSWMKRHYWQMRGYHPFFTNNALEVWNPPPTQEYHDLYALYLSGQQGTIDEHPEWILRSSADANQRLYIPFDCNGQTCPAYAGDLGNPAFRNWWIDRAKSVIKHGYAGLAIDNVNIDRIHTGNAAGAHVTPRDPRTGTAMTHAAWTRYTADFVKKIRKEFPNKLMSVNANQWWVPHDGAARDIAKATDFIELERGFTDSNIAGGSGTFGFLTMLSHIDWLHGHGSSIIYQPYTADPINRELDLAGYFLVKARSDAIMSDYQANRSNWWPGWDTYLGGALGKRYSWPEGGDALLRRDFAGGMVLVNDPGSPTRVVSLPQGDTWRDLNGNVVTSVSLPARRGKVLLRRIKTKVRQRVKCKLSNGKPNLRLKGNVVDRSGARISPPFPHKLKVQVERKGRSWNKVAGTKSRLKGNAKFRQRIEVGAATGQYRVRTKFKGNRRFYPAGSRFKGCSF